VKRWAFFLFIFIISELIFAQDVSDNNFLNRTLSIVDYPTDLSARVLNDHTVFLHWKCINSESVGFIIYRKSEDNEFIEIGKTDKDTATFTDDKLKYNIQYSYKIQCYQDSIKYSFSEEVTISTDFPEPSHIETKKINDHSVKISWIDNCDFETGFIIERKTIGTEYEVVGNVLNDETVFIGEDLHVGAKYYYRIKAVSKFNESLASDEVTVETEFPAPINVKAEALDDQSIRLTWNDIYDYENGFKIERKTGKNKLIEIARVNANVRFFVDKELDDGKTYTYIIKAFTGINESRPSVMAKSELIFPSPQKLYIDVLTDHSAKLYWEDSTILEIEYILERKDNEGEYITIAKLGSDIRSYIDDNMQLGEEYTYRIKAKSKVNESEYSNEIGTKTDFPSPNNLYAENVDDQSLKLFWEDNSSFETGFILERKENGEEFKEIATVESNRTFYIDEGLAFGSVYNYRIIAYSSTSESAYSNILSAKTIFPEPTYLSVLVLDDQSVKLSWQNNCSFNTGFKIERKMGTEEFIVVKELPATENSFVDFSLTYGTQYIYRIAVTTESNTSNYSEEIIVKTVFPGPSNLSSEVLDDRTASIYWADNCSFETGYKIERRMADEDFMIITQLPANSTMYTDDQIKTEKQYFYRVQAITSINESDFSNIENISTVFPSPSNLMIENMTTGSIKLKWNDNCNFEDGYLIERSQDGIEFRMIKKTNSNATEFIDKKLINNVEYTYRVQAFSDYNTSHSSNTITKYYGLQSPANFEVSVVNDRKVKLAWTDNNNIEEGYKIQRRTEDGNFKTIATLAENSIYYIDSELEIHEKYYYQVLSYANKDNSNGSDIHTAVCHFGELRVPEDFSTIQGAINETISGGRVIVQPGIYKENINFKGKNIVVCSKFYNTQDRSIILTTIIDGMNSGSVVNFANEETESAQLIGFTIKNGSGNGYRGGGIFIYNSSPSIHDVIIQDNKADKFGGGVYLYNSKAQISNAIIKNNSSLGLEHGYGGGIYISNSNPILEELEIINNKANEFGGGLYIYNSNPELIKCVIAGNETTGIEHGFGGGIYTQYSTSTWRNLTICDNTANQGGGVFCNSFSNPKLSNSILWNNLPQEVCFHKFGDIKMTLSYSNIKNAEDGFETNNNGSIFFKMGIINSDPMFIDAINRDYELLDGSPCIDTGNPAVQFNDIDGSRSNIGAK